MNNVTPRSLGIAVAGCWLAVSLASTAAAADPPAPAGPPPAGLAAAAPAPTPAAAASSTTAASEKVADDPTICKKTPVTGSRVRTNKICMTKSQWEAMSRNSQEYMKGVQRNGAPQPGGQALPTGG